MSARGGCRDHGTTLNSAISHAAWVAGALATAALVNPALAAKKSSSKSPDNTMAQRLFEQSGQARVEGDYSRSLALLREFAAQVVAVQAPPRRGGSWAGPPREARRG